MVLLSCSRSFAFFLLCLSITSACDEPDSTEEASSTIAVSPATRSSDVSDDASNSNDTSSIGNNTNGNVESDAHAQHVAAHRNMSASHLSGAHNSSRAYKNSSTFSNASTASNSSNFDAHGQFWAGADFGTLLRMENITGRVFYDFDGVTVKDPIKTLGDAGVNAVRVETMRGQCLGPSHFVNAPDVGGQELTFSLDWGCIDIQVETARQAVAQGMRVVLTINQGFNISKDMESLNYAQMIDNIQVETKRQLKPFLDATILPDVILLENEGSDGILFTEESTGRIRGGNDGKVSKSVVDQELCGQLPTGNMASYPQVAGYYKAEILACNELISASGFSNETVRYGLHSHGQYVQWKEGIMHGPDQASQSELKDSDGKPCTTPQVIPDNILAQNVSLLLTIAGFSAYPDPGTPTDINSVESQNATLNRLRATLTQLQGYAEAYGKYTSGPFAGQYKLQGLGVEYSTAYTAEQIPQQQAHTELMWDTVKTFSAFLGMMWYEPWYCYADLDGGLDSLCRKTGTGGTTGEVPTDTLKTWGKAAVSPWKN